MHNVKTVIILLIITIFLFITIIAYGCKSVSQSKQIDSKNQENINLQEVIEILDNKVLKLDIQLAEKQKELESTKTQNEQLQEDIKALNEKPKWTEKWVIATAYTSSIEECGNDLGITARGTMATEKQTVAMSNSYKFGTEVYIPILNNTYIVEDRGGAITEDKIDIYMLSVEDARNFGRKRIKIYIRND